MTAEFNMYSMCTSRPGGLQEPYIQTCGGGGWWRMKMMSGYTWTYPHLIEKVSHAVTAYLSCYEVSIQLLIIRKAKDLVKKLITIQIQTNELKTNTVSYYTQQITCRQCRPLQCWPASLRSSPSVCSYSNSLHWGKDRGSPSQVSCSSSHVSIRIF